VPALSRRIKEVDLLLVIGARLGDITTQGYTTIAGGTVLAHVYPDPDEIGRVFRPELAIVSGPVAFAAALDGLRPASAPGWGAWTESARADYLQSFEPGAYDGALDMGRAMAALRARLPRDVIITLDAGNHTGWPMRYLAFGRPGRLLGPTSGAMAYSMPAAVAASLVYPDRLVVGFVGDGGFLMSGQELSAAVQHGARPVVFLFNNGGYGTIRMHQEREHPDRVIGTDLVNPDFAAVARAYGAHGELVARTAEVIPAFERAIASGKAALIELRTDPNQITTRTTIAAMRAAAAKKSSR